MRRLTGSITGGRASRLLVAGVLAALHAAGQLAPCLLVALSRGRGLLWQDTAKTIPATQDGDRVRVAVCPYTGAEYTAPSDAARPILWEEGGGKWSLRFDGVDDILFVTVAEIRTQGAVYQTVRPSGSGVSFSHTPGADNGGWRSAFGPTVNWTVGRVNFYESGGVVPQNAWSVVGHEFTDGLAWTVSVDGVARPPAAVGAIFPDTLTVFSVGGSRFAGEVVSERLAGSVPLRAIPAPVDRTALSAYLAALKPAP